MQWAAGCLVVIEYLQYECAKKIKWPVWNLNFSKAYYSTILSKKEFPFFSRKAAVLFLKKNWSRSETRRSWYISEPFRSGKSIEINKIFVPKPYIKQMYSITWMLHIKRCLTTWFYVSFPNRTHFVTIQVMLTLFRLWQWSFQLLWSFVCLLLHRKIERPVLYRKITLTFCINLISWRKWKKCASVKRKNQNETIGTLL